MLPQLTVYAKILCLLMVVMIAGATREYMYLQSACSSKFVRIAKNGTVFADDNGQSGRPQTFTIEVFQLERRNFTIGVAIRCKETDMYLCFDKNWKIKGMKNRNNIANRPRCHFYESLNRGDFRYQSVINQTKYLGFVGSGKPINYKSKRHIDEKCYNFQRPNASAHPSDVFATSRSPSTTKSPHPHRHKHGMSSDQKRTRGKFNSHRTQNLADQGASSSQLPPSANNNNNNNNNGVGRLTRLITSSSVPSYRVAAVTQMSNDVHTTTQKPTKVASTKKQVKPSKRHGKTNRPKLNLYGGSNSSSSSSSSSSSRQHHRHHHDNRNSKLGSGRTMPTASSF